MILSDVILNSGRWWIAIIVLLLGGGFRPEEMLGTSPINNTGYHLYLTFFIFLVILTLVSVKYAQIIVPVSILMVVIAEIIGIISHYYLLILGLVVAYAPASVLIGGMLNVRAIDVGGIVFEYRNIISLMLFYLPIFSFYLLLIIYDKVGSPKKSVMKGYLLAPFIFLMTLLIIQEEQGSRAILLVFGMIFSFYISIIALPIGIFGSGLDKISDKRIKKWFKIAFFVPIIGPILFLIVFRNTEIETIDDAESENTDSG